MGIGSYTYECHDSNCAYCYFIKRKQFLRDEVVKALKESIPKPVKVSLTRKWYHWTDEELVLLRDMVNVPTDSLIKDKVFGERTKSSINVCKTIIRKQYNIKPLPRNYRIYHN